MARKANKSVARLRPPAIPEPCDYEVTETLDLASGEIHSELQLSGCDFSGRDVDALSFHHLVLEQARAVAVSWERLSLTNCRLRSCDLANASWDKAQLTRCELLGGRLTGFRAAGALLTDVVFSSCKLDLSCFDGATLKRCRFEGCDLGGASLQGLKLEQVGFRSCRLEDANLCGTRLAGVDLRGCDIEGLDIELEHLEGAIVDPAHAVYFAGLLGLRFE